MTLKQIKNSNKNVGADKAHENEAQRASARIIELNSSAVATTGKTNSISNNDCASDRIPIEKLRTIWNDKDAEYSDAELLKIREWCYVMVEAVLEVIDDPAFQPPADAISRPSSPIASQPNHSITLSKRPSHEEENCHPLRPGLYGRTG